MKFILNLLGKELAPLSVLRIIFGTYHFLTRSRSPLLRKSNVRNIFSKHLLGCHGKAVKSWKEMSTALLCLCGLWALETPHRRKYIEDKTMAEIFQNVCSDKRGTTDDILEIFVNDDIENVTTLATNNENTWDIDPNSIEETQVIDSYFPKDFIDNILNGNLL